MRSRFNRFVRRPPRVMLLFFEGCVSLAMTRLGLLFLPLRTVRACLRRFTRIAGTVNRRPASAAEIIWAVSAAERYSPVGSTCLAVALLGQALLQRHGYDSRMRIGVRRDDQGKFHAHAWLEQEGKIVIGGPLSVIQNYTTLPEMEHLIA